jgi:hypothetical protein
VVDPARYQIRGGSRLKTWIKAMRRIKSSVNSSREGGHSMRLGGYEISVRRGAPLQPARQNRDRRQDPDVAKA